MNRVSRIALGILFASSLTLSPARAEELSIDLAHSHVGFRVRHLFAKVSGQFGKFSGTIQLDPADLAKSSVKAEIDATSIDTNNESRDKHLKSPDFFNVEKFPAITFESTGVKASGKDAAVLTGNLTMLGVSKPVELKVAMLGSGKDPWGNLKSGFEATTTINRKDFGIVWNKTLDAGGMLLGDEVEISITVEAGAKKPEPAKAGTAPAAAAPPPAK